MNLNDVNRGIHTTRNRKRLGRGCGSGPGKTAGRGHKGHKSRSGYSRKVTFATTMIRRIPKRGFTNKWAVTVFAVNVGRLNDVFDNGAEVTLDVLSAKNIAKGTFDEVKILGDGEITKKLTVTAHRFSKSAEEKIAAAGGTVVKIPPKRTPKERVAALAKA
jgi:large subunit ribosomal protein L15